MNKIFKSDYYRMTGKQWNIYSYVDYLLRYDIRYLHHLRKKRNKIHTLKSLAFSRKYGLEILSKCVGEGLYIGHAHNINVHPDAVIGRNCNLNKGCTIGRENRGKRNGAPILGDEVWVGANASIVGNIQIGNDVLIAPNAYVNFDVPDHSIVIGNPAVIKKNENATEGYIRDKVNLEKKNHKVLFIINSFSWGGAEKLVYDLSLELASNDQNVSVVALYNEKDKSTEESMIHKLNTSNISTYVLGKKAKKGRVKSILDICKIIKNEKVDIVHAHCSVPMFLGKFACLFTGTPIVCTIHNTAGYSSKVERLTSWMVNKYISIGEAAEKYMIQQLGIDSSHICRIYNSVDVEKFKSGNRKNDFWNSFGGKENDYNILNVARVHEQKNQLCLLKSINSCIESGCDNIRLYILGHYDKGDPIYEELQEFIEKHKMSEHVTFLGMHTNVEDFLVNSDCFVMTSYYEGLSVAFLEAVIAGVPIVTTDLPFVHELNDIDFCSTIIPQNDNDKLAHVLTMREQVPPNEETIKKFETLFSLENYARLHNDLYDTVLMNKRN